MPKYSPLYAEHTFVIFIVYISMPDSAKVTAKMNKEHLTLQ